MTRLRIAAAWLCLAAAGYHYAGWIVTAFVALCVYWALWKRNPDSPFAIVAWPVWYITGFCAVAALLHSAIYLEPWGLCATLVLIEFYVMPMHRRSYAEWADLYNQGSRAVAAGDFAAAGRSAKAAYEAAHRIRWRGQEARAASALMAAQAQLKLGDAPQAERLASEAIGEFERVRQIQGVTLDNVYRIRGAARLLNGNPAGGLEDLQAAIGVRTDWAGEDRVVAETLLLAAMAQSRLGDVSGAVQSLRRAQPIAAAAEDENLAALIQLSLGSGLDDLKPLAIVQLGIDGELEDALRAWRQSRDAGGDTGG